MPYALAFNFSKIDKVTEIFLRLDTYIGCWYGSICNICRGSGSGACESVSVVSSAVSSVEDGDGWDRA